MHQQIITPAAKKGTFKVVGQLKFLCRQSEQPHQPQQPPENLGVAVDEDLGAVLRVVLPGRKLDHPIQVRGTLDGGHRREELQGGSVDKHK